MSKDSFEFADIQMQVSLVSPKENVMNVDAVATTSAMAAAVKQLQTIRELQIETMKQLAASQAQLADLLVREGVGQNIDVSA